MSANLTALASRHGLRFHAKMRMDPSEYQAFRATVKLLP